MMDDISVACMRVIEMITDVENLFTRLKRMVHHETVK